MSQGIVEFVVPRIYNGHFHPRQDDRITEIVLHDLVSSGMARGIPIFNYSPKPVETAKEADRERERMFRINPKFEIIPSIMLTQNTTPEIIEEAWRAGMRVIKYMPEGLSTNSHNGVRWKDLPLKYDCFKKAERLGGMVVMNHVEESLRDSAGNPITPFLCRELLGLPEFHKLAKTFPDLKMTIEHASTKEAIDYVRYCAPSNVAAGLSIRYALNSYDDVYDYQRRICPDHFCMPVYKLRDDMEAVRRAIISGDPHFFFAPDWAPHRNKNPLNPPAGVYAGPSEISLLATLFHNHGVLEMFGDFTSRFFAQFYELPLNSETITLRKEKWIIPEEIDGIRIYMGGQEADWRVIT